tara:strand:- start:119529 stop:120413 length:885 start_codon:yes stop_codon:yes gene_type:complete
MNPLKFLLATVPMLASLGCIEGPAEPAQIDTLNCTLDTYRVVSADVPWNAAIARDAAIDLNGDDVPDNSGAGALVLLLQSFESAAGLPDLVNERLQTDEAAWFIAVNQCPDGRYLVWALRGEDQDGDGIFELSNRDAPPAQGIADFATIRVADGGFGEIPIGIFADPLGEARDIWSSGAGLAAEFQLDDGALVGKVGLGLANDYATIIGRPLAAFFTSRLQAGTSEFAEEVDTNNDGIVSWAELSVNSLVSATILNPDLDLLRNDAYEPGRDGIEESLSFSFRFRAEPVEVRWQ